MTAAFARPHTMDAALATLADHARAGVRATLLAGGTDWMVERHMLNPGDAPRESGPVIDVTALDELRAITRRTDGADIHYEIGASVTYWTLRHRNDLARDVPMIAAMSRDVGAVQIQARGTLGGNLATGSPAADGVPVLAALGCDVTLASVRGTRRVPIDGFYTGYRRSVIERDEMIVSVGFTAPGPHWYWRKVGTRMAQSIAKVALAATARVEAGRVVDARFGMASVGPMTAMLPTVRAALRGSAVNAIDVPALLAALRKDIAPIDDVRSTGEYRSHVADRLIEQFVARLA